MLHVQENGETFRNIVSEENLFQFSPAKKHVFWKQILHLGTLQAEPLSRRIERGSACRVASWKQEKIFKQLKNIIASLMQVRIENISFCWTV